MTNICIDEIMTDDGVTAPPFDFTRVYQTPSLAGWALEALYFANRKEPVLDVDGWPTGEGEVVEDADWVVVRAIGDDARHMVERSELTEVTDDDFCRCCASLDCEWSK